MMQFSFISQLTLPLNQNQINEKSVEYIADEDVGLLTRINPLIKNLLMNVMKFNMIIKMTHETLIHISQVMTFLLILRRKIINVDVLVRIEMK